jgi:MerR family mercuric resistance operon transcriptional regulator
MSLGMTIGQAAREAGVGVETIRFYERQGLIEQPSKREGGGIRLYPADLVERIRFIREAQQLGFSLREASELLVLRASPDADSSDVRAQVTAKLGDVEQKIEQLQRIHAALTTLVARCPGRGELSACSILDALSHPRADRADPGKDMVTVPANPRRKGHRR